jgi:sialic acid synthase SpsE
MQEIKIGDRCIGDQYPPFIIAEVGINHEGEFNKAIQMVDAAVASNADCVKFQCHITEAEMTPTDIVPDNSEDKLWDIIKRCELTEEEERKLKVYCESKGILYLCTPFSREAADRLDDLGILAFKIGSGECNNTPLVEHIAKKGKPIILSTGMNDIASIRRTVLAIQKYDVPLLLNHCTSMYPTPYEHVHLGAITELKETFQLPVGLSDHSIGIYTSLGAVALGACAVEKHFTISRSWPGPDVPISIEPDELTELVEGANAIHTARGGKKELLPEEQPVIDFAYASVVAISDINAGETFSLDNLWVKRPGSGQIPASDLSQVIGRKATKRISKDTQISNDDIS